MLTNHHTIRNSPPCHTPRIAMSIRKSRASYWAKIEKEPAASLERLFGCLLAPGGKTYRARQLDTSRKPSCFAAFALAAPLGVSLRLLTVAVPVAVSIPVLGGMETVEHLS